MNDPKLDEIRGWLTKAHQDLDAAFWLLESPISLHSAVGFHCQQSAEKALKAYLTSMDYPFDKTHSLIALVSVCLDFDPSFDQLRNAATFLNPFAVTFRYPGDVPEISREDAEQSVINAKEFWEFIVSRLPSIDKGSTFLIEL
jgi:HEPN domain-containing protein